MNTSIILIGYLVSSSCLSIVNKWALLHFPFPAILLAVQFTFTTFVVLAGMRMKFIDRIELSQCKIIKFMPAIVIFYISLFSSNILIQYGTVDTLIAFRSSTPLAVLPLEMFFLKRPFPGVLAFTTLLIITAAGIGYSFFDSIFDIQIYMAGFTYVICIVVDSLLLKEIVHTIELSDWGLVYYNNLFSLCLFPLSLLLPNQTIDKFTNFNSYALLPIFVSCVLGVAISYFGMNARQVLTATTFTVLGVGNKFATIVINALVWKFHATLYGTMCLVVSVCGGILYHHAESWSKKVEIKESDKNSIQQTLISSKV